MKIKWSQETEVSEELTDEEIEYIANSIYLYVKEILKELRKDASA